MCSQSTMSLRNLFDLLELTKIQKNYEILRVPSEMEVASRYKLLTLFTLLRLLSLLVKIATAAHTAYTV